MKRGNGDFGAPPGLSLMLSSIDFLNSERREFVIARDLVERNFPWMELGDFLAADAFVERLLADASVTNSDMKGLLKRLDLTVALEYSGSPRDFFAAFRIELANWIARLRALPRR